MKKVAWRRRIKQACESAGTYREFFDPVIDTLADILERRDDAKEQFKQTGGKTVVVHTNKNGATNLVKNPAIVVIDELNKTALQYWRDLGLTPAGLKRIDEEAMHKPKKETSFADVLGNLGI